MFYGSSSNKRRLFLLLTGLALSTVIGAASTEARSMKLLTPNAGWMLTGNHLLYTSSAGFQWTDITPPASRTRAIYGAYFLDTSNGWMLRAGPEAFTVEMATTADSGANWSVHRFPLSSDDATRFGGTASIDFVDPAHGWAMLRQVSSSNFSFGMLFATTDGGLTWTRLPPPPLGDPVRFDSANDGRLEGGPAGDQAWETHDGGTTWQRASASAMPQTDIAGKAARSVAPDAAAVQSDVIDGKQAWVLVQRGVCAGEKIGCQQQQTLLATTDAGGTFHDITAPQSVIPESTETGVGQGFDQCAVGTTGQMQAWFSSSPYRFSNVYIGGGNRACGQANLSSGWVSSVIGQGWHLVPTWVGLQAPCSSCTSCSTFSSNTSTAASQAVTEANNASNAAAALGLTSTVIYYDLEEYGGCGSAAAQAFVNSWTSQLHARGNVAGVYGGAQNAQSDWAGISHPPDDVWIALWNNQDTVLNLYVNGSGPPLSNSLWANNQRLHQYVGGHNETYGGVTFSIDTDVLDGAVTPGTTTSGEAVDCYVFNDGYTSKAGPSNAVFINSSGQACIPNGGSGTCRRWSGECYTTKTKKTVDFYVFDNGYTNLAGPSNAVYINSSNQACIPGGSTGVCRRWFGRAVASDGRKTDCKVFASGYANQSGYSDAVFINSSKQSCVPSGSNGYCQMWWGLCSAQ